MAVESQTEHTRKHAHVSALPVLYSFRRCPYAIRARSAIVYSGIAVELRDIELRNKPTQMLAHSPKGTVPVLILPDGRVIDESLDIMHWALAINDPEDRACQGDPGLRQQALCLIEENDLSFKAKLDRYKYWNRYPEFPMTHYRQQAEVFLSKLEEGLLDHEFLLAERATLADMAIAPFIRQFALADKGWFDQSPYPALRRWLETYMASAMHQRVMEKKPIWQAPTEDRV